MIYLDNSATTPVYKEVIDEVTNIYIDNNFNPSSAYDVAHKISRKIKDSRQIIANSISADENEIVFTSGGSESCNTAILGVARANVNKGKHLITSSVEHDCVYKTMQYLQQNEGFEVTYIKPDKYGEIQAQEVEKNMRKDTILVSLMNVNNETGAINDIKTISNVVKTKNINTYFHTDCVQSYMKIPIDVSSINVDLISASGHKIHATKGIGFLYIRKNTKILPLIFGGGQESGFRSGTENVAGICALSKAVQMQSEFSNIDIIRDIRDYLCERISQDISDININTPKQSAPHILSVSFAGIKSEILLHYLEMDKIYVSTGSACSSKKKGSRVLDSIDLDNKYIDGTLRFSLGYTNTRQEVDFVVDRLKNYVSDIRKVMKYKG